MVVFTCNYCGDSLQKPKVEKHYAFVCRRAKSLTCVDCLKDFNQEEYAVHNKCITEEERYAAKGTVTGVVKKGDVKQEQWTDMVRNVMNENRSLKPGQKQVFEIISNHSNIPRKKVKFLNFMKSCTGGRVSMADVESVWNILEEHKSKNAPADINGKEQKTNDESAQNLKRKIDNGVDDEEKPKKKKKKKKETDIIENEDTNKQNGEETSNEVKKSKKKSKKNKNSTQDDDLNCETVIATEDHETLNNGENNQDSTQDNTDIAKNESKKTKKKSKPNGLPSEKSEAVDNTEETPQLQENSENSVKSFDIKEQILNILEGKSKLSLKKLEKKVCKAYVASSGNSECSDKFKKKILKKLKTIANVQVDNDFVTISATN